MVIELIDTILFNDMTKLFNSVHSWFDISVQMEPAEIAQRDLIQTVGVSKTNVVPD